MHRPAPIDLDEKDRSILRLLQEDAKKSLRNIAEETKIPFSTVKKRLDRLIATGVIEGFFARLDCCKIGYKEMLMFSIKVNSNQPLQVVAESLASIKPINAIYQISGTYPLFAVAKCIEKEDQIALLEKIKLIPGVEEVTTQVVLQKIKEDMRVLIP